MTEIPQVTDGIVTPDHETLNLAEPTVMFHCRVRKSPFFKSTRKAGARAFSTYNHMWLPSYYTDPDDEYWALVNNVTLWDVSVERMVEITGPDAFRLTNMLTPRDLTKCNVGQCKYIVVCDEFGGILNDPVLARLGENHFWLALADSDLILWVKALAFGLKMDVRVTEPDVSPLQIQGPKSRDLMHDLFGDLIDSIKHYHCIEVSLDGIPLLLTRTGYTGELGYEIYLRDGSRGEDLWERIVTAGKPYKLQPIGPCNARRIEAGMMSLGFDMTMDDNPYQIYEPKMLKWLVDLEQDADFIGREALARIHSEGVKRKLVGIEIPGDRIVSAVDAFEKTHWDVRTGKETIGDLRSMAYSPKLEKSIGFAMVPVKYAKLGTRLDIVLPSGDTREATVVEKPFVDPEQRIQKS